MKAGLDLATKIAAATKRSVGRLARRRTDYVRFIVLTRSRTGSNMLVSCLNSHPCIVASGEVFSRLHGRSTLQILEEVYCPQPRGVEAVGFKIFYYHPQDDDTKEIWQVLLKMEGLRVLHLRRQNVLRTLLSRKIAGLRDVWSSLEEGAAREVADKQVSFTAEELRSGFVETRNWESEYTKLFQDKALLDLTYEQLVAGLATEFRRITEFLGVEYAPPGSTLKKQNPEPLRELIRDYDELKREFTGSPWLEFFDE